MSPVLSILIITHNQRDLLRRCFKSVIAQELEIPFEIVISDDRSSDGTDELVRGFQLEFEGKKRNLTCIKYVHCNSDECSPLTVSERCGWNKLTAYNNAEGKYFVNIDADDYLLSTDIYQLQVDALELHPECSMCMQRALSLNVGDDISQGTAWPTHPKLVEGKVLSSHEFIMDGLRGLNQTYMIRRQPKDDMRKLYGKEFDDTVITYHHLQYGPVVFIDRADYVWVQYPKSISHNMTSDDSTILYGLLPLHHAKKIPAFKYLFLRQGLPDLIHLLKWASKYPNLSKQYRDHYSNKDGFIYKYYTEEKHSLFSEIRYNLSRALLLVMKKYNLTGPTWLNLAESFLLA